MTTPELPAFYSVQMGSEPVELPIVPLREDFAIALFMSIDHGTRLLERTGAELAALHADSSPDIVVSAATLGIPVAIEVTRALGLDDYLILQKTPKIHLKDALSADLESVTTGTPQKLLLDRARLDAVAGRRVLLVDDVVSSGGSLAACLRLLDEAGAEVVGIGALLAEGSDWKAVLGDRAALVRTLGEIPLFVKGSGDEEGWTEVWG